MLLLIQLFVRLTKKDDDYRCCFSKAQVSHPRAFQGTCNIQELGAVKMLLTHPHNRVRNDLICVIINRSLAHDGAHFSFSRKQTANIQTTLGLCLCFTLDFSHGDFFMPYILCLTTFLESVLSVTSILFHR